MFNFFVQNDQKCTMENLEFFTSHKEVKIFNAPKILNEFEVAKFNVEWKPSVTIKKGLTTSLEIKGYEVWK